MTYSLARVNAHHHGDCDAATCPLCATDCDRCDGGPAEPQPCGDWHCAACVDDCRRCQDEMAAEGFVQ